jgi:hypothetical protein
VKSNCHPDSANNFLEESISIVLRPIQRAIVGHTVSNYNYEISLDAHEIQGSIVGTATDDDSTRGCWAIDH